MGKIHTRDDIGDIRYCIRYCIMHCGDGPTLGDECFYIGYHLSVIFITAMVMVMVMVAYIYCI